LDLPRVLILFADALSAPEVAWSLHDAGHAVIAIARRSSGSALRHSRHVDVLEVTDPAVSADRCLAEVRSIARQYPDAMVMPLDDHALWLVQRLESELRSRLCGPVGSAAAVTLDKRLQYAAAVEAGFDVPATVELVAPRNVACIRDFPCIVKPALAARVVDDRLGRGHATVLADAAQARSLEWDGQEPMLTQAHLRGVGEGLFGLALESGVVAWSAHRRVRMMNPAGSGSSACTNIEPDPELCARATRFLGSLGWRGLFMIELLRDADGIVWFIELNGRAWGSMALARRRGYEYPAWAVRAMREPAFEPCVPTAQSPIVCRHVARELVHLLFVLRGPPRSAGTGLAWPRPLEALRDLLDLRGTQSLYNWRWDDPIVFVADLLHALTAQVGSGLRGQGAIALVSRASARAIAALRLRAGAAAERRRQRLLRRRWVASERAKAARHVLFVCYGNINRSMLAEVCLAQAIISPHSVSSCGFHRPGNRPADPRMSALAARNGLSLNSCRSRTIDADQVGRADLILAMEARHLVRLNAEYPMARDRTFLLGSITSPDDGPLEIRDPYGGTPACYERCFEEIVTATSALARLMRTGSTAKDLLPSHFTERFVGGESTAVAPDTDSNAPMSHAPSEPRTLPSMSLFRKPSAGSAIPRFRNGEVELRRASPPAMFAIPPSPVKVNDPGSEDGQL